MNVLEMFQSIDWQYYSARLAVTLAHLLWQGMIAGAIVVVGMRLLKNSPANYRYLLAVIVLFALPVVGVVTFASFSMPHTVVSIDPVGEYPNVDDGILETGGFEIGNGNQVESEDVLEVLAPTQLVATSTDFSSAASNLTNQTEMVGSGWLQPILQPVSCWLSMLYVLGVAVMGLRLLFSVLRGIRLDKASRLVDDRATLSLISKVADRIGLAAAPAACFCERVAVPVVVGIWKPVLLMPVSMLTNLTQRQLTAIISHELAHIRRFDPLVQLLQRTAEALLFFHPVVWWISRQISNERENCCDDVAAASGVGRVEYALSLLRIAELCLPNQSQRYADQFAALSARGTGSNQLVRRIERQLRLGETPIARPRWTLFCSAILLLIVFSIAAVAAAKTSFVENPDVKITENAMSDVVSDSSDNRETQLAKKINEFNRENRLQQLGVNQPPLTEAEVITAIRSFEWKDGDTRLNELEAKSLKDILSSHEIPEGAYFSAFANQQSEPFVVCHFWHVQLYLPAIGHDGFVPFTIRNDRFADEIIDSENVAWGKPDADGMTLGGYLSPMKQEYQLGDRVRLHLFVKNNGTKTVRTGWPRLLFPMPDDFTVVEENGEEVRASIGDEKWQVPWVSGHFGGGLRPGGIHFFNVPFEIQIGGSKVDNTPKRVGRLIEATPGQSLRMQVRATTGSYRNNANGNNLSKTGEIKFSIGETGGVEPAKNKDMEKHVTVSGRVIGEDGKAIANLPIAIDYITEQTASINAQMTKTDAHGQFAVEDLPSDARIFVRYSRWSSEDINESPANFAIVEVTADNKEARENVILDLSKSSCTISGKLEDKNGRGVSGAEVKANYQPTSNRLDHCVRVKTNQDGAFKIEGLPASSFSIAAIVNGSKHGPSRVVQLESDKATNVDLKDFFQGQDPSKGDTEPSWGKTFDDGLQAGIMIEGKQSEFEVGDIVRAKLIARNTSDTLLTFTHASATDRFHLELTPAQAEKNAQVETRDYSHFTGWVADCEYQLKPGQQIELATLRLQMKRSADKPDPKVYVNLDVEPGMKIRLVASLGDGFKRVDPRKPKLMPGKNHPVPTTGAVEFKIKDKSDSNDNKPSDKKMLDEAKNGDFESFTHLWKTGKRAPLATIFERAVTDFRTVKRRDGHMQILKWCVDQGLDPMTRADWIGQPLICTAAMFGNEEIVKYMLERKPVEDLFVSASLCELDVFREIIRDGDPSTLAAMKDTNGFNLLHYAAGTGIGKVAPNRRSKQRDIVQLLIENGVPTDMTVDNNIKLTPALMCAWFCGDANVMQMLIDAGDIDVTQLHQPLEFALEPHQRSGSPHLSIAETIVKNGFDINSIRKDQGRTVLHGSANRGTTVAVRWLLENGADPNILDEKKRSPLHSAAIRNTYVAVVKMLLDHGAKTEAVDSDGKTALELAKEKNRQKVIGVLQSHQETQRDRVGKTDFEADGDGSEGLTGA